MLAKLAPEEDQLYWIIIISVAYFLVLSILFGLFTWAWVVNIWFTSIAVPIIISVLFWAIFVSIYVWVFYPFLDETFPHW